jgi:hypothetical protein
MVIDDDAYHDWGPTPSIELRHKSIDYKLLMWKAGARYDIVLWERQGDVDRMLKAYGSTDYEEAMHLFALQMNELEMF